MNSTCTFLEAPLVFGTEGKHRQYTLLAASTISCRPFPFRNSTLHHLQVCRFIFYSSSKSTIKLLLAPDTQPAAIMRLTISDSRWSTLLRGVLITLFGIFALSLVTLILSGIWAQDMAKLAQSGKPSNTYATLLLLYSIEINTDTSSVSRQLVFYTGTMPFLTLFWAALDIGLASMASLSPMHALISSIALLSGWLIQFSIWMQCELTAPVMQEGFSGSPWCPNAQLSVFDDASTLQNVTENLACARAFIGLVVAVGAFVYMVLAAVSVARNKKATKTNLPLYKNPEYEASLQRTRSDGES